MAKRIFILINFIFLVFTPFVQANSSLSEKEPISHIIKGAIQDLIEDNAAFAESKPPERFQKFIEIQNPRTTMILCSDSRVQVDNFSQGAENDIFVARNIGNQFTTTKGSIEYGVNILKTPLLIFIGHPNCGAIKAAMGNYSYLSPAIQKELKTLNVKAAPNEKQGVVLNVHQQVEKALDDFKERVNAGKLAIVGAIYDFRNDYGYGKGQLIIVNLNGNKNPQKIQKSHYFDNLQKVSIGIPNQEESKTSYP